MIALRHLRGPVSLTGGQSQASIFNDLRAWLRCAMEGEMVNQPTAEDRLIDRRSVLRTGAALAAAGPALLHGAHAKAQPRPGGASPIPIIDAQVHAYAANTPDRPWHTVPDWPPNATAVEMGATMSKVAVDGALYISPFSMYKDDATN